VRFLVGTWAGEAQGEPGKGSVERSYEIVSPDEFTEIFELAEPGKEFQVYSRNHFKRQK
jgi:hypothetical protein